jgi:hypothetical protein
MPQDGGKADKPFVGDCGPRLLARFFGAQKMKPAISGGPN